MAFETTLAVRFSDVDPAGIAFYPTLVSYLHLAFEDLFERFVGRSYARVIQDDALGFPAVDLRMQFSAPFRFGEWVRVRITVKRLGHTSATFRYQLFGAATEAEAEHAARGAPRAEAQVTVVCVRLATLAKEPPPPLVRAAFERLQEQSEEGPR